MRGLSCSSIRMRPVHSVTRKFFFTSVCLHVADSISFRRTGRIAWSLFPALEDLRVCFQLEVVKVFAAFSLSDEYSLVFCKKVTSAIFDE